MQVNLFNDAFNFWILLIFKSFQVGLLTVKAIQDQDQFQTM